MKRSPAHTVREVIRMDRKLKGIVVMLAAIACVAAAILFIHNPQGDYAHVQTIQTTR